MLVLGIDTSWKQGNIALVCDDLVLAMAQLEGGTFSAQLVPQIARLLSENKLTKGEIDGFSVVSGPGSFTGLRVGLAAVKALAEILHKPIAATSVLEAMVLLAGGEGKLAAALDAGRGEMYAGEYDVHPAGGRLRAVPLRELVVARADAAIALRSSRVICCEPAVAELLRFAGVHISEQARPDSGAIGRIGTKKITSGETVSPERLDANYIRRSDAELFTTSKP